MHFIVAFDITIGLKHAFDSLDIEATTPHSIVTSFRYPLKVVVLIFRHYLPSLILYVISVYGSVQRLLIKDEASLALRKAAIVHGSRVLARLSLHLAELDSISRTHTALAKNRPTRCYGKRTSIIQRGVQARRGPSRSRRRARLTHIARELGVHPSLLQTCRRKYGSTGSEKAAAKPPTSFEDENRRLRRENAVIREDREILKKRPRSLRRIPIKYAFIEEQRTQHSVRRTCELLSVSPAGYYEWRGRPPSPRALVDATLAADIKRVHAESRRTYGRPRIHAELAARGCESAKSLSVV